MTDPGLHLRVVAEEAAEAVALASASVLSDLFHRVWSVIPTEQEICDVSPDARAAVAISLRQEHGFSQIPVREGREVLGVFSHRSFSAKACEMVTSMPHTRLEDVPVEVFIATPLFVSPQDELHDIFDLLDATDAVFVGSEQELVGIITSVDVLRWLHNLAEPFVRLGEIEKSLRAIVKLKLSAERIAECAQQTLRSKYHGREGDLPTAPEAMTFDELRLLVVDGRNWELLTPALGTNREFAGVRLSRLPTLRNDVFHFKRELEQTDRDEIEQTRTWLLRRLRALHAQSEVT